MYGLRYKTTKELVRVRTDSNCGGEFCCDEQHILTCERNDDYEVWEVEHIQHAEWVRQFNTEWYNAGYETPSHSFKADELEIIDFQTEEVVEFTIITILEAFQSRLKKDQGYLPIILDYLDRAENKNKDLSKDYCNDFHRIRSYYKI